MIQVLAPWAAAGLLLLAGPLLVHMLLRRNARRIVFPATRFLIATRAAAVRLRAPSDLLLLAVRMAVVGAAVAAAVQPIVVTPRRMAQWDARVIRAIVVDTSASTAAHADASRLAEQQTHVFRAQRFDAADLAEGLSRAAAWLADAPPGRREVVIVSDFQRGALDREDLAILPADAGVATIRAGTPPASRDVELPAVSGFRGAIWRASMRVDPGGTVATWTKSPGPVQLSWLSTSQAEGDRDAAARAVYAAASEGVAAGDVAHRVRIRFSGAPPEPTAGSPVSTPWMADAALALRRSALLAQTSARVRTAERGGELLVDAGIPATSPEAAAVVRAALLAVRPASIADREAEVLALPDAELASWRREAAPIAAAPRRPSGTSDSDARWFWALALALLGAEAWLRRRDQDPAARQVRDAA